MVDHEGPITLTREELHAEVWSSPMRELAARFGMSDVGLAKTCKRMKIPVPGRGYWAKKAAGKKVRSIGLAQIHPSDHSTPREITFRQTRPEPEGEQIPSIVAEQIAFESLPENKITVNDHLRRPHELVRRTADALSSTGSLNEYVRNWQMSHLDLDVTKATLRRALRIADALIKALEQRGWKVMIAHSRDDHKTYVEILGHKVAFGIREPIKKVANEKPKPHRLPSGETYEPYYSKYRDEATGNLSLVIRNSVGTSVIRAWNDRPTAQIEDRLNDFVVGLVEQAHSEGERVRKWAMWEEERRAAELARMENERKQALLKARGSTLDNQVRRWRMAADTLEYLAAIRARVASGDLDETADLNEWLCWAEEYATSHDPLRWPAAELLRVRTSSEVAL